MKIISKRNQFLYFDVDVKNTIETDKSYETLKKFWFELTAETDF